MSFSVILISYGTGRLRECLDALARQPEVTEIVVSDCSAVDPATELAPLFPAVRFLHFPEKRSVPQLRWAGVRQSHGTLVAAIEARTTPSADWSAVLMRAHAQHPDAPVVGGPVALGARASARDEGFYFCEYGRFAPPVATGPVAELSGANLSYRRDALEQSADVLDAGQWETGLHLRWRAQGRPLVLSTATVFFENVMPASTAIRQRFGYGRGYAAARLDGRPWLQRIAFAAFCPLLPALLTLRLGRSLRGKPLWPRFWRALPWILLFNSAWAAGECVGYLIGESGDVEIY